MAGGVVTELVKQRKLLWKGLERELRVRSEQILPREPRAVGNLEQLILQEVGLRHGLNSRELAKRDIRRNYNSKSLPNPT